MATEAVFVDELTLRGLRIDRCDKEWRQAIRGPEHGTAHVMHYT